MRPIRILKTGRFGRHALLLSESQSRPGHIKQGVFFRWVGSQAELARATGIHKFQFNIFADALNVVVRPIFEGIRLRFAAALIQRPLVVLALCMAFKRVRLAVHDVDAAAVGSPAGNAGCKMLVGIGDAPIMLFLDRIID